MALLGMPHAARDRSGVAARQIILRREARPPSCAGVGKREERCLFGVRATSCLESLRGRENFRPFDGAKWCENQAAARCAALEPRGRFRHVVCRRGAGEL